MNALDRAPIEKAGYNNGWENVRESGPERVVLFSARHRAEADITAAPDSPATWRVVFPKGPPTAELTRSLADLHSGVGVFVAHGEATLGRLLRRAAELAMSLPDQAADRYAAEVAKIEAAPPSTTEALALVKQRRGQELFREALMDYWGGTCAVTGIAVPELLRASHAKPWAKCETDQERLNVFNGFLLCAHLDALFDRGLVTFDDDGCAKVSLQLDDRTRAMLALDSVCKLRWISPRHLPFMAWHRQHLFNKRPS